jgi:hypothetical protein
MKHHTKNVLRSMARHFGLKIVYVNYFGDDIHGQLLPREKRILINSRKPRYEHIFTLLDELGHFVIHVVKFHKIPSPRYLDIHWKSARLAKFFSKVRRSMRFYLRKHNGKEWEADLWAVCAFIYLAKLLDLRDELRAFQNRHPEKASLFMLAAFGVFWGGIKSRVQKCYKSVLSPLQTVF